MSRRNLIIGLAIGIPVLVAAIVLLVVGVTTHEEGEFLYPCFDSSGEIDHYGDDCQERVWDAPIKVGTGMAAYSKALDRAVRQANQEFGIELFEVSQEPMVEFIFNVPHEPNWFEAAGYVRHYLDDIGRLRATVYIGNTGSDHELHWVLMHELGHVVFLEHDDFPASTMYYFVREQDFSSVLNTAHFTDHDSEAIRSRYPDAR